MISDVNFHQFYSLYDPLANRPFRLDPEDSVSKEMAWQLSRSELMPDQPIRFLVAMGGQPAPLLWSRLTPLICVHQHVIEMLSQHNFTGWATYPVEVYSRKGVPIPDYHGFAVIGRGGKRDIGRSKLVTKPPPVEGGKPYQVYLGLYFYPEQWDGSDFFFVDNSRVVHEEVVKEFKRAKIF
jgi:hypothetical protein